MSLFLVLFLIFNFLKYLMLEVCLSLMFMLFDEVVRVKCTVGLKIIYVIINSLL